MSQSSTTQNKPTRRKTAFAVGAVFVMVGVAFAATMYYADDAETVPTSGFGSGTATDPVASLTTLSAPLGGFDEAASTAVSSATSAHGDASAEVEASIASATERVDAAAGTADHVLAGTDGGIGAYIEGLSAYDIEELQAQLDGSTGASFLWQAMPSTVALESDAVHFEPTGDAQVDEVLLQIEVILAQVQGHWAGPEVQGLFTQVEGASAEAGAPVAVPGLIRSPFGAEDAVEPDESGAFIAQAHADTLLETVDGGYGKLYAGMQSVHASQVDLSSDVDAALETAAAFQADAHAAIAAEHEDRLDAIAAAGAEYEARLTGAAEAYVASVEAAAGDAEADLSATLDEQIAVLESSHAEAEAVVEAQLADVQQEAQARLDGIAEAEAAVQAGAEAGAISQADAAAFFEASAEARAQIEAQVEGAEAEVDALQAELEAELAAQVGELESSVADARADIDARVTESRAWADSQVAMLRGDVDGTLTAAASAQTELRASAEAAVDQVVKTHATQIEARAYAAIEDARSYAATAQATVSIIQGDAYTEVGNDLAYIEAVVDDYASIPTPERQAAADAWASVYAELDGTLGSTLVRGGQITAQADAVMQAAAAAEAALDAKF